MTWSDVHVGAGAIPYNSIGFPSTSSTKVIAGGQVGWNWQAGSSFVVGLEGDASGLSISGSGYAAPLSVPGLPLRVARSL